MDIVLEMILMFFFVVTIFCLLILVMQKIVTSKKILYLGVCYTVYDRLVVMKCTTVIYQSCV